MLPERYFGVHDQSLNHCLHVFTGYVRQVWKFDDLLVLAHIPETPVLPNISFKSMHHRQLF
jgi:hypothetical protein